MIGTAGVVGLGTMGAGIAEVFARADIPVVAVEPDDEALTRGRGHVERSTGRAVERGRMSAAEQAALTGRITYTTTLDDLSDVDIVVEAIPERMDLKRDVFGRLDAICRPEAVLASNTSSLSITEIAAATSRPAAVVGLHFFNPAPFMRLVEVIRGVLTDDATAAAAVELARRLGKTPVSVTDRAGFVANALLLTYLNRAVLMLDDGGATRDDIDTAMRVGAGLPLGPFALIDLVGVDVCVDVLDSIYDQTRDRLHAPAPTLRRLTSAGLLGRKSGRGFYTYDRPNSPTAVDAVPPPEPVADAPVAESVLVRPVRDTGLVELVGDLTASAEDLARARSAGAAQGSDVVQAPNRAGGIVDALLMPYLNEAVRMRASGYASVEDIDTAVTHGCGYPAGPFAVIDELGAGLVVRTMEAIHRETGEPGLVPAPLLIRHADEGIPFG